MTPSDQIRALAFASSGNYPQLIAASIAAGASADVFFADLTTAENREPVAIAMGQVLTAGELLYQTFTATGTAGSNTGNGVLTIQSVGLDAVIGVYSAVCTSARTNRGLFELRDPAGDVLDLVNVGTPYSSSVLNFTIADGSSDFIVGDSFAITVAGSSTFAGYDFAADPAPPQVCTAVLSADVDTTSAALEQFATHTGPGILSGSSVHIGAGPDGNIDAFNTVLIKAADQLARRGIVLRGGVPVWVLGQNGSYAPVNS